MVDPEGYVDVNVFVYWLGAHPVYGKIAHHWIRRIEESPRGKYITSSLTLYQVAIIMAGLTGTNLRDEKLIRRIMDSIINLPGLAVVPLTLEDALEAVGFMEKYDLDYEDAIHLAAAIKSKAKEIISNDQDFDKTPLKRSFL
jgi:predicted nucleic acid-binding protein